MQGGKGLILYKDRLYWGKRKRGSWGPPKNGSSPIPRNAVVRLQQSALQRENERNGSGLRRPVEDIMWVLNADMKDKKGKASFERSP